MAGMPMGILMAYRRFIERLIVHNVIAGSIGKGYSRRCGLPQGCPLSMQIVALLMRPWILLMRCMHVVPKVLADDVLIVAQGRRMLAMFAHALHATHTPTCRVWVPL